MIPLLRRTYDRPFLWDVENAGYHKTKGPSRSPGLLRAERTQVYTKAVGAPVADSVTVIS